MFVDEARREGPREVLTCQFGHRHRQAIERAEGANGQDGRVFSDDSPVVFGTTTTTTTSTMSGSPGAAFVE